MSNQDQKSDSRFQSLPVLLAGFGAYLFIIALSDLVGQLWAVDSVSALDWFTFGDIVDHTIISGTPFGIAALATVLVIISFSPRGLATTLSSQNDSHAANGQSSPIQLSKWDKLVIVFFGLLALGIWTILVIYRHASVYLSLFLVGCMLLTIPLRKFFYHIGYTDGVARAVWFLMVIPLFAAWIAYSNFEPSKCPHGHQLVKSTGEVLSVVEIFAIERGALLIESAGRYELIPWPEVRSISRGCVGSSDKRPVKP